MDAVRKCQGVSQKPIGCGNVAFECSERHVEIDSPSIVDDLSSARLDLTDTVNIIRVGVGRNSGPRPICQEEDRDHHD